MIEKAYWVCDNGLRCFASPCFCWDVVDVDTQNVSVVSDLDLSQLSLSAEQTKQMMESLTRGQLHVKGYMVAYEIKGSEDLTPGKGVRFVVVQILGQANP